MLTIMNQRLPVEFLQDGENIVFRLEEYDTVRTIRMNRGTAPEGTPHSPLGYSVGEWDDTTLVVTTTHINSAWVDQLGIPQSTESVLLERFTPSEDGSRLSYELTITDPVYFTEPMTVGKTFLYLPGATVERFDCSDSEG